MWLAYDLRQLHRKGLIQRRSNTNHYAITPYGRRVALFFTKLDARVFRPVSASFKHSDDIPRSLATALQRVDQALEEIFDQAKLAAAA